MTSDKDSPEIVVCLGSSCFARGNAQNLSAIEAFLSNHGLADAIRVTGRLCKDECKLGPNLTICGDERHEVNTARLRAALQGLISEAR